MTPTVPIRSLQQLLVSSGVNPEGQPFCAIEAIGDDGTFYGQLPPEEVRTMALGWLAAAEASEQDAVVYLVLTKEIGIDPEQAGTVIASMRSYRGNTARPSVTNEDLAAFNERQRILAEQDDDLG